MIVASAVYTYMKESESLMMSFFAYWLEWVQSDINIFVHYLGSVIFLFLITFVMNKKIKYFTLSRMLTLSLFVSILCFEAMRQSAGHYYTKASLKLETSKEFKKYYQK